MVMRAAVTKFIDDHGRGVRTETLGEEVAFPMMSGVRRVVGDAVASGLSPERLALVLRQAAIGDARAYLTLAEEMEERYLHYASQLQTRRLAIEGVPITVEADKAVPTKIVDAVNELIDTAHFEPMIGMLTDGIAKGYSAVEMIWDYRGGLLRPERFIWRDPRFFCFDELSQSELRLAVDSTRDGVPLDPAKFITHVPRSKTGIPIRRGMARPAGWAFLIQSFALRDWASFAEIYGVPIRIGKYHASASDKDKLTLLRAVRSIANDAAAVIPMGMEMEFVKVEGQHGTAVFGGLIEYVDKQVSKLILGQTMTSDDGSSQAQANVHNEVRLDIKAADCKQIAGTLNRDLVRAFVDMNFGPQEIYPRIALPVAEPEDIKALTEAVSRLVPLGLRISAREIRERVGLSEPEDGEELLGAPAPTKDDKKVPAAGKKAEDEKKPAALSAHVPGCLCTGCAPASLAASATAGGDEVDALAAAAAADWEEITDPLLSPLRNILAKAKTFGEALSMLDAKGPDASRLAELLAKNMAIARGIGDVRD